MNELIFFIYIIFVVISNLIALFYGKEALVALVCIKVVLMNLLVPQEILLFGWSATSVDALSVGTSLSLNLLNEYYGVQETRKAIHLSVLAGFFYVCVTILHRAYVPAPHDIYASYFEIILSLAPRIIAASCAAYIVSQKAEASIYARLKNSRLHDYFILRNSVSLGITQALDTVLFSYLGLYGIVGNINQIIFVSYCIKIITCISAVPLIAFGKNYFRKA